MTLHELMSRDLRTHLVVGEVVACGARVDGLEATSEPLWAACSACLATTPAAAGAAA